MSVVVSHSFRSGVTVILLWSKMIIFLSVCPAPEACISCRTTLDDIGRAETQLLVSLFFFRVLTVFSGRCPKHWNMRRIEAQCKICLQTLSRRGECQNNIKLTPPASVLYDAYLHRCNFLLRCHVSTQLVFIARSHFRELRRDLSLT